jgi:serine acetyltransferase
MAVDTSKLPPGSVVPDDVPPGHVSVRNVPPEVVKQAVIPKPPKPPYNPDASGKLP